jgi:hypothetical protein
MLLSLIMTALQDLKGIRELITDAITIITLEAEDPLDRTTPA